VVGYKKEEFFYLEDLLGVRIVVNEDYARRNNNSTLYLVRERLGNTYICSSDDYFVRNPFETYVYSAYYAAVYFEGETDEYMLETKGRDRLITSVTVGGRDGYAMMGHAYFDRAFSSSFVRILMDEYDLPETAGKLWEDIYREHIPVLPMVMRPYGPGEIFEFDSLEDLRTFDPGFIENVDSAAFDNICGTLGCSRDQIHDIVPIKQGLTNLSCKFLVGEDAYVYRHPGNGTGEIINRKSESASQRIAADLGIDGTFVYEDPEEGWKISRFVEGACELDYGDWSQVEQAMDLARRLHSCGITTEWTFDVYDRAMGIVGLLDGSHASAFRDFPRLLSLAAGLHDAVSSDGVAPCLCHNDMYAPNFLVSNDGVQLIDWEYSACSDYASDLGTFICCSHYDIDETQRVLSLYFKREPTGKELRHCLAYVGLCSFYWFVWALYKESKGETVGEWLYLWYKGVKRFGSYALNL
jgi:CTP:phosphocholine cytidylyltransferase-like protein/thiamine kinase-like enzyme